MGLITIAEANTSLPSEVYPDWDAIPDDPIKQHHIDRASAYIRNSWDFPLDAAFSWDDDLTWIAGTKDLIARYADAVRSGLIYGDGTAGTTSTAPIKRTKAKAGSLEIETEYAQATTAAKRLSATDVDDQMFALGYRRLTEQGALIRV